MKNFLKYLFSIKAISKQGISDVTVPADYSETSNKLDRTQ